MKKIVKTVYKITTRDNKSFLMRHFGNIPFEISYNTERFVKPKTGKVFCFEELGDAENFLTCQAFLRGVIWEAEGTNPIKADCRAGYYNEQSLNDFWANRGFYTSSCPKGTLFVDSLKLIKQVE